MPHFVDLVVRVRRMLVASLVSFGQTPPVPCPNCLHADRHSLPPATAPVERCRGVVAMTSRAMRQLDTSNASTIR
jgi:hypothetical protein